MQQKSGVSYITLGALRHLHCETTIELAADWLGLYSQIFVPLVCWYTSSDCGYAKQPKQSDECINMCLQSRLSGGIFSVLHDGGDEMSAAVDQPSWWYDLILAQRSRMGGWKRR